MTDMHPPVARIRLRDGGEAELRPIVPEDRALLITGLEHMSAESRFARFGSGISHLSEAELRYLTELDLVSHVAWGALIDDQPAGVGRYVASEEPGCAEIAVAVVDRHQRRGLGRALFDSLVASARANGIKTLCFSIQPSNRSVLRMIRGVDVVLDQTEGMVTGRMSVDDIGPVANEELYAEVLARYRAAKEDGDRGRSTGGQSDSSTGSSSSDAELMQ
ncbi:MAG: GNAT family N-acetyltransferase [Acidimicrobiia bacterium]